MKVRYGIVTEDPKLTFANHVATPVQHVCWNPLFWGNPPATDPDVRPAMYASGVPPDSRRARLAAE